MPYSTSLLPIPLDGTGTEIPALNVTDSYDTYEITGSVTTTGNYAIVPTGTPQAGTTFEFDYNAVVDITTNGNTFSIFGVALNQTQLLTKLKIVCRYDGSAWKVRIWGSLDQAIISSPNYAANSIANSKLATMGAYTLKGNNTGSIATPQDIAMASLTGLNYWSLIGNSGTNAGTNFLGTTDAQDLVFKTNNNESGRIDLTLNNTSFGDRALSFVGRTGDLNVAIGTQALQANDTGYNNTAVGHNSLTTNQAGYKNTAIGKSSLQNLDGGIFNTSLGETSGTTLVGGNYNTILGATANVDSASSSKRIAIGYGALADQDAMFALPNDVTKFKWRGVTYTMPSANAAGVLTNDGSGNLTWV